MLTEQLHKRLAKKAELEAQLAIEENKKISLTEAQILAFLDYVCEIPSDDVNKRRTIINASICIMTTSLSSSTQARSR